MFPMYIYAIIQCHVPLNTENPESLIRYFISCLTLMG